MKTPLFHVNTRDHGRVPLLTHLELDEYTLPVTKPYPSTLDVRVLSDSDMDKYMCFEPMFKGVQVRLVYSRDGLWVLSRNGFIPSLLVQELYKILNPVLVDKWLTDLESRGEGSYIVGELWGWKHDRVHGESGIPLTFTPFNYYFSDPDVFTGGFLEKIHYVDSIEVLFNWLDEYYKVYRSFLTPLTGGFSGVVVKIYGDGRYPSPTGNLRIYKYNGKQGDLHV